MRTVAVLTLGVSLLVASGVRAASAPVPVKATSRNEVTPVAGGEYLAWAKSRRGHPHAYDVWIQHGTDPAVQVNARGTTGFAGGFDGSRLVYQQIRSGFLSDLRIFDAATGRRTGLPAGVNTRDWEWAPTISGDWILFSRGEVASRSTQRVMLQNLLTGEQRVLDTLRGRTGFMQAGQVNGNYAVWTKCPPGPLGVTCDVYRYDIALKTRTMMPRTGQDLFGASVTPAGTTYYGRDSFGCGGGAELAKTTLSGATFVLYSFPGAADMNATYSVAMSPQPGDLEATRIYFERLTCHGNHWDAYSIDDTTGLPPP